MTFLSPNIK